MAIKVKYYFDVADFRVAKIESTEIVGFIGVAENNVEMLFVSPKHMNHGIWAL